MAVLGIICIVFWRQIAVVAYPVAWTPLIMLALFVLCQLAWCYYLRKNFKEPREYLQNYPNRYYLEVGWRRLISKSADIAAQQAFIIVLVVTLQGMGLAIYQVIAAFLVLFGLLHVPLVVIEWGRWPSWLFAGAVLAFSLAFPLLVLFVPYGFVYAYMLHWLFYMATASIFWWHHSRFMPRLAQRI